jgi:hypothetical protein
VAWDQRPDRRTRRALLHLSYSYAPPCGPAMLVTHGPGLTTCALQQVRLLSGVHRPCGQRSRNGRIWPLTTSREAPERQLLEIQRTRSKGSGPCTAHIERTAETLDAPAPTLEPADHENPCVASNCPDNPRPDCPDKATVSARALKVAGSSLAAFFHHAGIRATSPPLTRC